MPRLWITWESQRRNKSASRSLNARLIEIKISGPRVYRYFISLIATTRVVLKERPQILFVQNPSIVLALFSVALSRLLKSHVVIDAHYAGIFPFEGKSTALNFITSYLIKSAEFTIVTNQHLVNYVQERGGNALLLPDPLPSVALSKSPPSSPVSKSYFQVLFICTWANDEPFLEVLESAKLLDSSFHILVTGNWRKVENILPKEISSNITLTGFVSDEDFDQLLRDVDIVMDLTTRDHCLVCGAYEGIAAQKPLILSDKAALRNYFDRASVFTLNNSKSIAQAILSARENLATLNIEAEAFKEELSNRWHKNLIDVERKLRALEEPQKGF